MQPVAILGESEIFQTKRLAVPSLDPIVSGG